MTFLYNRTSSLASIECYIVICALVGYDKLENSTDANANDLLFGRNAEEYNPVTGLEYLRARYYQPDAANFITQDTVLGTVANINSQNRYSYAEGDPVNNADPSGHVVGNSSYERTMERAGGSNEILNFYVGQGLQNNYNAASAAFNGAVNRAYGTDYRDINAINGISGVSQAAANGYIGYGAVKALTAGASWGCMPGALTGRVVRDFARDVEGAKNSANAQIASVKAGKYGQYNEYQAWLAQQQAILSNPANFVNALRTRYNITGPYSNEFIVNNYGQLYLNENGLNHIALAEIGLDFSSAGSYAGQLTWETMFESKIWSKIAPDLMAGGSSAAKVFKVFQKAGLILAPLAGLIENIQNGASAKKITIDATVDLGFAAGGMGLYALITVLSATNPVGWAAVGATILFGLLWWGATEVATINGLSLSQWAKRALNSP